MLTLPFAEEFGGGGQPYVVYLQVILNPGEAAILALGAIRRTPWIVGNGAGERIEPRWVTQLALSFDHRLIDGQQGSQLLADTAAVLRDPGLALL
jgi:2-oxoisovalerate dehydrogenase E2 component (dihydrolipoyl transacylase)